MARRNASPQQIIRKDGNNCFVEALTGAFEIGKLHLKFVTYDTSRAQGSKFTNEIDIYMDLSVALRICYDALDSGSLIKNIMKEKAIAQQKTQETGKKVYAKQIIIHQGGTSAVSLAASGKSRQDGMAVARVLKIFAGDKLPVMFKAEMGPGETDKKGLIIPKYGYKPESYVQIGMSADDFKEFFVAIRTQIQAYYMLNIYNQKYEAKIKQLEIENNTIIELLKMIVYNGGNGQQAEQILQKHNADIDALKPKYANSQGKQQYNNQYNNNQYNNQYNSGNQYNNSQQTTEQDQFPFMNLPEDYEYPFV